MWRRSLILILSVAGLTGCAAAVWFGNPAHPRAVALSVGMSKQEAQRRLGPPQQVLTQEMSDVLVETWKYLDRTLTFQNGRLKSWVDVGVASEQPKPVPPASGR